MANTIHVEIVSAEEQIFSGEAEMVYAPAIMGEVIGGEKMGKLATEVAAMIQRVMAAL